MLLVINAGNTNIRVGIFLAGGVLASVRIRADRGLTGDRLGALVRDTFGAQGLPEIVNSVTGIAVASVVPPLERALSEFCAEHVSRGGEPLWIRSSLDVGMPVRYEPVGALGSDRFVNAYAARERYGAPVIVVDFGTATTFEAVDRDGVHRGGAILPGLSTGRDALKERTAQLPLADLDVAGPIQAIGTSTAGALHSGILLGAAAVVEGMVSRFRGELDAPGAPVVGTGGLAAIVGRHTDALTYTDPDLTLTGLGLMYRRLRVQ